MEQNKRMQIQRIVSGKEVLNIDDWQRADKFEAEKVLETNKKIQQEQQNIKLVVQNLNELSSSQQIDEAKEEIKKHIEHLENYENMAKEIDELLNDDVVNKDYKFNSDDEYKKFVQNFLESELSSYKKFVENEDQKQQDYKKMMKKANRTCILQKMEDFARGLSIAEITSFGTCAAKSAVHDVDFDPYFAATIGTACGVLFGYGLYLASKNRRNFERDKNVEYLSRKMKDSCSVKSEMKNHIKRCEQELNALKY